MYQRGHPFCRVQLFHFPVRNIFESLVFWRGETCPYNFRPSTNVWHYSLIKSVLLLWSKSRDRSPSAVLDFNTRKIKIRALFASLNRERTFRISTLLVSLYVLHLNTNEFHEIRTELLHFLILSVFWLFSE